LGVKFTPEFKVISVTMPFNRHSPIDARAKASVTNLATGRANASASRRKSRKVQNPLNRQDQLPMTRKPRKLPVKLDQSMRADQAEGTNQGGRQPPLLGKLTAPRIQSLLGTKAKPE